MSEFFADSCAGMKEPARKKMRKGTKSCLECRRRKMKCTYDMDRPLTCKECQDRSSTCISQQDRGSVPELPKEAPREHVLSTKERVRKLESSLDRVMQHLENDVSAPWDRGVERVLPTKLSVASRENFEFEHNSYSLASAPALSLFNNSVFMRHEAPFRDRHRRKSGTERDYRLCETLRSLLPDECVLQKVLSSDGWWRMWRQMHPDVWTAKQITLSEYVFEELASKTPNPVKLGKVLICIAISLNQTEPDFYRKSSSLACSPEELMDEYVQAVERLVTADDETAGTLEGVETIFLTAKHHGDVGRPRKSYILLRRAILFAQLLGLHRMDHEIPTSGDMSTQRQRSLWMALYQADRLLSLTLGLPCCIGEEITAPAIPNSLQESPYAKGTFHMLSVLAIAGRITERNQTPSNMSFSETMRLEQELEEAKDSVSPGQLGLDRKAGKDTESYQERLMGSLIYNHIRTFLHMPFMLKSATNPRYQYSRLAAVEGAREVTLCYHALRGRAGGHYVCKVVDFVAFIAAMLILLNLLGYSSNTQEPKEDSDWELIYQTIRILLEAAKEAGGIVASQSARTLQTLAQVRDGREDGQQHETGGKVTIPYFGTIGITHGKHFVSPSPAESNAELPGGRPTPAMTSNYRSLDTTQTQTSTAADFLYDPLISFESAFGDRLGYWTADQQQYPANTSALPPGIGVGDPQIGQGMPKLGLELDVPWDWIGFGNHANNSTQWWK